MFLWKANHISVGRPDGCHPKHATQARRGHGDPFTPKLLALGQHYDASEVGCWRARIRFFGRHSHDAKPARMNVARSVVEEEL